MGIGVRLVTVAAAAVAAAAAAGEAARVPLYGVVAPGAGGADVFYATARVGSGAASGSPRRLQLSTSSGFLAVFEEDCGTCGWHDNAMYRRVGRGASAAPFPCDDLCVTCAEDGVSCAFRPGHVADPSAPGASTRLLGVLAYDSVSVGGGAWTAQEAAVGSVRDAEGPLAARAAVDGVLGVAGPGSAACVPTCVEPPLAGAAELRLCLGDVGGWLDVANATSARAGDAGWAAMPLYASAGSYDVTLGEVLVNGASVWKAAPGQHSFARVDTSRVAVGLPSGAFNGFVAAAARAQAPGAPRLLNGRAANLTSDQVASWPTVSVRLAAAEDGMPAVDLVLRPSEYLVPAGSGGGASARVLGLASGGNGGVLGLVALRRRVVTLSRGGAALSPRVSFGALNSCDPPVPPPPPAAANPVPRPAPAASCHSCVVGGCPAAAPSPGAAGCLALQRARVPFAGTGLPEGCRGTWEAWACGEAATAFPNCTAASAAPLCASSCRERARQLARCGAAGTEEVAQCEDGPDAGGCAAPNVSDPLGGGGAGVACHLAACGGARVTAESHAACDAWNADPVLAELPDTCRDAQRPWFCEYRVAADTPGDDGGAAPVCRESCEEFAGEMRRCAGDEFPEALAGVCDSLPRDGAACVTLRNVSAGGSDGDGGDGPRECWPCHLADCPGEVFLVGSRAACDRMRSLEQNDGPPGSGAACVEDLRAQYCHFFRAFSEYVTDANCTPPADVCRTTCAHFLDAAESCDAVSNSSYPVCTSFPTSGCVDLLASPGGSSGGSSGGDGSSGGGGSSGSSGGGDPHANPGGRHRGDSDRATMIGVAVGCAVAALVVVAVAVHLYRRHRRRSTPAINDAFGESYRPMSGYSPSGTRSDGGDAYMAGHSTDDVSEWWADHPEEIQ